MSFVLVDRLEGALRIQERWVGHRKIGLDCEAAGFHRYSDRLCLVQISTIDGDYIFDPLSFDPATVLRPLLEDPETTVVAHGADYDVRLLDRDLGIRPTRLFDTQAAAALLGEPSLGLAPLLNRHLGVELSKKYQRADWARRPLPDAMLDYAASDSRHLSQLADALTRRLLELNRMEWAEEEFRALEQLRWEEAVEKDPVAKVRGARSLTPRQLESLRQALDWRDQLARARDRAAFRIVGDASLLELARTGPRTVEELARLPGMSSGLARAEGPALLARLEHVDALAPSELPGYPRRTLEGAGRPPVDVEELAEQLKKVRNRVAEALGIDRGTLLANSVLTRVAWERPGTMSALRAVPGMKAWQAGAVGKGLLEVLKG